VRSEVPPMLAPLVAAALAGAAWLSFELAERLLRRDRRLVTALALLAAAVIAATALVVGWRWLLAMRVDPTMHAYGATTWTLLGYMAMHVALGALMAAWCLARLAFGMMDSWRSLTLRVCLLWWRFTAPLTVLVLLLVTGLPHVLD
jgi:cytochrome c oxidase subunit I+III